MKGEVTPIPHLQNLLGKDHTIHCRQVDARNQVANAEHNCGVALVHQRWPAHAGQTWSRKIAVVWHATHTHATQIQNKSADWLSWQYWGESNLPSKWKPGQATLDSLRRGLCIHAMSPLSWVQGARIFPPSTPQKRLEPWCSICSRSAVSRVSSVQAWTPGWFGQQWRKPNSKAWRLSNLGPMLTD